MAAKDGLRAAQEGIRLRVGADGDAEVVFRLGVGEPADQDFALAQFLQPDFGGEFWGARENEIGLAGKDGEACLGKFI